MNAKMTPGSLGSRSSTGGRVAPAAPRAPLRVMVVDDSAICLDATARCSRRPATW